MMREVAQLLDVAAAAAAVAVDVVAGLGPEEQHVKLKPVSLS